MERLEWTAHQMVEIYLNNQRCPNVESQLLMNWNLKLPNNLETCNDILSELQKAIDKLEESNEYIRNALKIQELANGLKIYSSSNFLRCDRRSEVMRSFSRGGMQERSESDDAELLSAVEENELVIRRKRHQVEQLTSHIESLVRH